MTTPPTTYEERLSAAVKAVIKAHNDSANVYHAIGLIKAVLREHFPPAQPAERAVTMGEADADRVLAALGFDFSAHGSSTKVTPGIYRKDDRFRSDWLVPSEARQRILSVILPANSEGRAITVDADGFRIFLDGDQWCAVPPGFVDLQASQSAFGVTPVDALERLMLVIEPKIAPAPDRCPSCDIETYVECPSCTDQMHFESGVWKCGDRGPGCGYTVAPGQPLVAPALLHTESEGQ